MKSDPIITKSPTAFVVGLCAHGLTIVRALAKSGVTVITLEADPDLPGCRTRYAQVQNVPDINGCGLITTLQYSPYARTCPAIRY